MASKEWQSGNAVYAEDDADSASVMINPSKVEGYINVTVCDDRHCSMVVLSVRNFAKFAEQVASLALEEYSAK